MFTHIFEGLENAYRNFLSVVIEQYPFETFKFKRPVVRLTFEEGCKILNENGFEQSTLGDLHTANEKALGKLVREKYDTDFYIMHRYPMRASQFYTMPCADNENFSCSYEAFMRGEEIISGAQRIHKEELLINQCKAKGVDISSLKAYIDSFKYGAFPHGGVGVGLERIVKCYLNLYNIRKTSMFPRDPHRLTP